MPAAIRPDELTGAMERSITGPPGAPTPRRRRRRRRWIPLTLVLAVLVMAGIGLAVTRGHGPRPILGPPCTAASPAGSYGLTLDQAANATTIAAVGERMGLPAHAVTVALAAALQESELHNLAGGDRDSSGLFQQRPSQGWGTPAQIQTPSYAAQSFYTHLARVPGWETMEVTAAAQAVQRSAAPSAYADWESEARVIASVLTGEVPAGFTCHFRLSAEADPTAVSPHLTQAMTIELGPASLDTPVSEARGWQIASWLVGHASLYGVTDVTFDGQHWTPVQGSWRPAPPPRLEVQAQTQP
jgi:hypothetical protein